MESEAIRSIRNLFLLSLAILVLWLMSWRTAVEKIHTYRDARDLQAWILLKERMEQLNLAELDLNETIDHDIVEIFGPRGGSGFEEIPIIVAATWPNIRKYQITLEAQKISIAEEHKEFVNEFRLYKIVSRETELPLFDYNVAISRGSIFVIPAGNSASIEKEIGSWRLLERKLRDLARAKSWERINLKLAKHGSSLHPDDLNSKDKGLLKLQVESDPRIPTTGVRIMGMQLSIGLFFSTVGIFLGVISFALIGPILALHTSANQDISHAWIIAVSTVGKFPISILERVIFTVTICWALLPIFILVAQYISVVDLEGIGNWAFPINTVGLIFSSIIFVLTARQLRMCRRRKE